MAPDRLAKSVSMMSIRFRYSMRISLKLSRAVVVENNGILASMRRPLRSTVRSGAARGGQITTFRGW